MKATQLTQEEVNKIIRALALTYGDESSLKLAEKLWDAKAVITTK